MLHTVLILGAIKTSEVQHLMSHLSQHTHRILLLDTRCFGSDNFISWDPVTAQGYLHIHNEDIAFSQIHSVFWDHLYPFTINNGDTTVSSQKHNDKYSLLEVLLLQPHIRWFNSVAVIRSHKCKPWQLAAAAQCELLIPETCIGNHPDQLRLFLHKHTEIAVKPVHGGRFTYRLNHNDQHAIDALCDGYDEPKTLQQYIGGTNIRSYFIDNYCFSGELQSAYVDFREDLYTRYLPHTLPDQQGQRARNLMQKLGMRWGAIDWRLDEFGRYYFLEINPAPRFEYFEAMSQLPIAATLSRRLCSMA